ALGLGKLGRVAYPRLRNLDEQLGSVGDLAGGTVRTSLAVGALEEAGQRTAAFLEQAQHVAAELFRIGDPVGGKVDGNRNGLWAVWGFFLHRFARIKRRHADATVHHNPYLV